MARKFKRKLSPKVSNRKIESVLSIQLIRKEYLLKLRGLWKNIVSKAKALKLAAK